MQNSQKFILFYLLIIFSQMGAATEKRQSKRIDANEYPPNVVSMDELITTIEKYGLTKLDVSDTSYSMSCSGFHGDRGKKKMISVNLQRDISNKTMSAPKDAYINFCNGVINYLSTSPEKEIKLWGWSCKGEIESDPLNYKESDEESDKWNRAYTCDTFKEFGMQGILVPKGSGLAFNDKQLFCISIRKENKPVVVDGVKLEPGAYEFKNGKAIKKTSCWSDTVSAPDVQK